MPTLQTPGHASNIQKPSISLRSASWLACRLAGWLGCWTGWLGGRLGCNRLPMPPTHRNLQFPYAPPARWAAGQAGSVGGWAAVQLDSGKAPNLENLEKLEKLKGNLK